MDYFGFVLLFWIPPLIEAHPIASNSIAAFNDRPIIGILSQEPSPSLSTASPSSTSYIAASYVKFIESAGARVVPIRINQTDEYYTNLFHSINGLLLPGGGVSIEDSGYARAGSRLFDLALEANNNGDYFPVWATCLGFELLTYLSAGRTNVLTECHSYDRALPLKFQPDAADSHLFKSAPRSVYDVLSTEESTSNFHHWCLTPANFSRSPLGQFYRLLATSVDDTELEFVSVIEAIHYPFWGVQFHPEKSIFEWSNQYRSIPHSAGAIRAAQYFGQFFVEQARQNSHTFPSAEEEDQHLIYHHWAVYTANVSASFVQSYFFD